MGKLVGSGPRWGVASLRSHIARPVVLPLVDLDGNYIGADW